MVLRLARLRPGFSLFVDVVVALRISPHKLTLAGLRSHLFVSQFSMEKRSYFFSVCRQ